VCPKVQFEREKSKITDIISTMEGAEDIGDGKYPMTIAERRFKGILMWQCEAEE
jgi:hypothetical protein